jgi:hypothetical protein
MVDLTTGQRSICRVQRLCGGGFLEDVERHVERPAHRDRYHLSWLEHALAEGAQAEGKPAETGMIGVAGCMLLTFDLRSILVHLSRTELTCVSTS